MFTLAPLSSAQLKFLTLVLLSPVLLFVIHLMKNSSMLPAGPSAVMDNVVDFMSFARNYVATVFLHQLAAISVLLASVIHLNIDAHNGYAHAVIQALGVGSMTCAVACMFLLHLLMHPLAVAAIRAEDAARMLDSVRRISSDRFNFAIIVGAPKKMLLLSLGYFVMYRATANMQPLLAQVPPEIVEKFGIGASYAVTLATFATLAYTATIAKAFIRLTGRGRVQS